MKNTNERAAERAPAAACDISSRAEVAAELQEPFVERRKTDRRQQDRRREPPQSSDLPGEASVCTGRERQIVLLLRRGMTNKQIAQALGIAEDTVKKHLHHVYRKLGVRRRALLIVDRASAMQPRNRSTPFVE